MNNLPKAFSWNTLFVFYFMSNLYSEKCHFTCKSIGGGLGNWRFVELWCLMMTEPNWSYRQQGADCGRNCWNNLFASALRNGSGTRIVLLSAKTTNPSVGIRRQMHKRTANKPVGALIHDYQREGASWSKKCLWQKDCPDDLTALNTDNVNFCTRSGPYQHETHWPSGPGPWPVAKSIFV